MQKLASSVRAMPRASHVLSRGKRTGRHGCSMKAQVRSADVVSYLTDIGDELSPSRFRGYISELRTVVPKSAYADLVEAYRQLRVARQCLRRAARRVR